jgi:predicted RNA-binding protein associated with RNAse of E/G family
MKKKHIFLKLQAACDLLSEERLGDCDPQDFVRALQAGLITDHQVYAAMAGIHRIWNHKANWWHPEYTGKTRRLLAQLIRAAQKCEVSDEQG